MRIMLVLGTSTGGVGTHVRALARDLAAAGHDIGVVAPESTADHFGLRSIPGAQFEVCPMSTQIHPRDVVSVRHLRRLIRAFSPDVVHAHGFRAGLFATLAVRGRRNRPRLVTSWHNQATAAGWRAHVEAKIEALIARGADLTIGASEDLVQRAREVGARGAVFSPVAAPTATPTDPDAVAAIRARYLDGDPAGTLLGVAVGRVAPQKNYDLLISALEAATHPVHVLVAGAADETLLTALQARIAADGTGSSRVTFLGPRSDVTTLLAAADLYLLTSHWEARALVLQEALRAGLPIIATNTGGTPGLLAGAGILVDPASPTAASQVAAAMDSLADAPTRALMSKAARQRAASLPDEIEVANILLRHYAELLATHP